MVWPRSPCFPTLWGYAAQPLRSHGRAVSRCGRDHIPTSDRGLPMTGTEIPDYYELLEISPKATQETIHRVYRFLATRYHPDHSDTGDLEKFSQITSAYKVLSDPARRAEYNGQ